MWFWQLSSNMRHDNERKEWIRYSDFKSEFIEEAHQRMDSEVQLDGFIINFKFNTQRSLGGTDIQRSIKRDEIYLGRYMREERFCCSLKAIKSFESKVDEADSFFYKWLSKNQQIKRDFSTIANLAAQGKSIRSFRNHMSNLLPRYLAGILEEGKLLNQEFDSQRMAEEFRDSISKVKNLDCAARLYTAESFLYKLVNSSLRSNDMSKMETLGPFCYLLYHRLRLDRIRGDQILYRGMNLNADMLDEYKQAVGQEIVWPAFTSTSKDYRVAEIYSVNTLFIILSKDTWRPQNDISKLSFYPDEQEVLFSPFCKFIVDRVSLGSTNEKHLIYLTTANT